jgi:CO/xanthine dehydrogenase Mo-binding subunit
MEYKYIGNKQCFVDAKEKVSGTAKYLDDMTVPNMLYAKFLRSPHPHARIVRIDTGEAEALPGVRAVLTGKDCPKNHFGLEIADVEMLNSEKARYVGDEIAAVAAESEEIAEEAIRRIHVEYELLPVIDTLEKAMAPGAPLVHEDCPGGNIAKEYHFSEGNLEEDFASCDYVFEKTFCTHRVQGLYMEPFGCIAQWESNGRLTMWTGLQSAFQGRNEIAKALGIDPTRITIKSPVIGGGFGAKIWIRNFHPVVAVLARATGRPVKYVMSREEEMLTTRPRVAPQIHLKLGMMKDGTMVAKEAKILADNGAYSWAATKILLNMSVRTDCLYRFRSCKTDSYLIYTNLIPTSGFRGYGNSQAHYALESMIDWCCKRIGLDPVQVRLKNCVRTGDLTLHGWKIKSCGLSECLEAADRKIREKRLPQSAEGGRIRRGIATACMTHVSGNRGGDKYDGSSAMIRIHEDGKVFVFSGESNLGQGAYTVFAEIAAEVLGVSIDQVVVMPLDTDVSPFGLGTYSSRVTTVAGKAIYNCALKVKDQILNVASEALKRPKGAIDIKDGVAYYTADPRDCISLKKLCALAIRTNRSVPFTEYISYDPPTIGADSRGYGDYSSAYTYAAQSVEVEVDTVTGFVKVLRVVAAHDVGKVINPGGVIGQINGGVAQGIGWTLYENMQFKDGIPQSTGLHKYTLMTIKDMPEVESVIVESNDPIGPFGAKGIGEPTLIPTGPAIANAIEDAVGVRITDLPITPEKVYRALKEKEASK